MCTGVMILRHNCRVKGSTHALRIDCCFLRGRSGGAWPGGSSPYLTPSSRGIFVREFETARVLRIGFPPHSRGSRRVYALEECSASVVARTASSSSFRHRYWTTDLRAFAWSAPHSVGVGSAAGFTADQLAGNQAGSAAIVPTPVAPHLIANAPVPFACAPVPFACAPVPFACALVPFACALVPFACAPVPFACAPVPFACGPVPFACGPVPFACAPVPFTCAPVPFTCAPVPFTCAPVPFTCAPVPFACAPVPFACAPVRFTCAPVPFACAAVPFTCAPVPVACAARTLLAKLPSLSELRDVDDERRTGTRGRRGGLRRCRVPGRR